MYRHLDYRYTGTIYRLPTHLKYRPVPSNTTELCMSEGLPLHVDYRYSVPIHLDCRYNTPGLQICSTNTPGLQICSINTPGLQICSINTPGLQICSINTRGLQTHLDYRYVVSIHLDYRHTWIHVYRSTNTPGLSLPVHTSDPTRPELQTCKYLYRRRPCVLVNGSRCLYRFSPVQERGGRVHRLEAMVTTTQKQYICIPNNEQTTCLS